MGEAMIKSTASAVVVGAALLALSGCSQPAQPSAAEGTGATGTPVVWASALDRYASDTVNDWATNADAVADVSVVDETALPPTDSEVSRGEGLIGRRLNLQINDVLWDNPGTDATLPKTIELKAFGWTFKGNGADRTTARLAARDTSRLEVGHRYVMGLVLLPAECSGNETNPAAWASIGSSGVVPFDNKVRGAGEYQGSIVTSMPALVKADNDPETFRDVVATRGVATLPRLLAEATPRTRTSFGNECPGT